MLPCADRKINCDVDYCQQEHIFCSCSPALEVPIEDRAYVKDQRLKKGPKDFYQMTSEDRVAVKRALRSSASFLRSTVDSSSFPCTSIQSSTDTDSASVHSEVSFNKQYEAMTASDTKIMSYSHEQKFKTTSQKCRFSVIGMLLHQPNSIVASYIFSLHCFAFSANFYFCSHFLVDLTDFLRCFKWVKKVIKRGSEGPDSCPTWAKPI